ncbi:MAG TPA: cyclopropane-fatty-acyl-phospholipid synthase family protein [Thermoanaerobaculia bacterium]|jgi:cyclopropane-fatty-acyl-phospholipid synthase|nr:cyclopropane-fatty-acyl-phospholipid synthase family protein [Thermoanaerobaculia bacterium]
MPGQAESTVFRLLDQVTRGHLVIRDPAGREKAFGKVGEAPRVNLLVHDQRFYSRLVRGAALGLGESYMDGWWDEADGRIVDLMSIIYRNDLEARVPGNLLLKLNLLCLRLRTIATVSRSRVNAEFHYDTSNEFFQLILDPLMTYSCGYQCDPGDTLEEMQLQKYELISRKLDLQPGDRLLDIGCGWGGMLRYAAKNYGARGLGLTLSPEQAEWARQRIQEDGLGDRLEIRLQDYREVEGEFDKVVSVGMFEHVGREYHAAYMRKVCNLLRTGGLGVLHTIGATGSTSPGPWLRKYIFPGTYLPGIGDFTGAAERAALKVVHLENLKPHYAETARCWKENFHAHRDAITKLRGFGAERVLRKWDYFFQLLEGSFRFGDLQVYQMLFYKGKDWAVRRCLHFTDSLGADARPLDQMT